MNSLLTSLKWYSLVPDQTHKIVTSGFGTFDAGPTNTCSLTNDYVTTSYLVDGTASISYTPRNASLTIDMSNFSGQVTAKWYDPTTGNATTLPGSPYSNSGTQIFIAPGNNAAGDPDWVLLLTTS